MILMAHAPGSTSSIDKLRGLRIVHNERLVLVVNGIECPVWGACRSPLTVTHPVAACAVI